MGIKLGDVSPLGGALTGRGVFGKGLAKLADSGVGFLVPMSYLAQSQRDKKKKKKDGERGGGMTAGAEPTMRKGGKVKKMAKGGKVNCRRGDGICRQGRTRGKMR